MILPSNPGPIGIFDSGYGGLTILHGLRQMLPQYDYMYLGDNARAPYGSRSFEVVYKFTRQAVLKLFSMGCHLVILVAIRLRLRRCALSSRETSRNWTLTAACWASSVLLPR